MASPRLKLTPKVFPLMTPAPSEDSALGFRPVFLQSCEQLNRLNSVDSCGAAAPGLRTKEIWARVRIKLRGAVLLSLLCQELRLYGTSSFLKGQNINYKKNVELMLQRLKARKGDILESEESQPWCYVHPHSNFRKGWNCVVIFLLLYTALIMPYRLAFSDSDDLPWFVIERIIDGLFFTDVVLTCFTAVELEDGSLQTDFRKIIVRYMKSWMVMDLVSCVPFSLISNQSDNETLSTNGYNNMLRLVRLPRLYRLLRIARLYRLLLKGRLADTLERIQDCLELDRGMIKVFYFGLTVLVSIHVAGCLWFYMAKLEDFGPNTWMNKAHSEEMFESSYYIKSIYWACSTLTTVGYGDITGGTDIERLYSMLWMSFSVGFYSFTISSLTSILTHLNSRNNNIAIKLNAADQMVREGRLSQSLKNKLRRAIRINSQKAELDTNDKQLMFDALPKKLRYEVAIAMYEGAAAKIPFFQGRSPEFISTIVPYLRYSFLDSGDYIYREGDDSDELYIILRGRVTFIVDHDTAVFKRMLEGSYFGDVEVILRCKRLCTSVMEGDGELLVMMKPMLKYVADDFPEVYEEMQKLAYERRTKILMAKGEVIETLTKLQESDTDTHHISHRSKSRLDTQTAFIPRSQTYTY